MKTNECLLCDAGFPLVGRNHIPTQSLGMIPVTPCSKRNAHGVKDASECYRTINGQQYVAWTSHPSAVVQPVSVFKINGNVTIL